jgi:NADH:ubiquinone oxidoreductase subunit 4 (subunit M)
MGFVLMAIAAGGVLGTTGAVFQMVSHGLLSGLLFALAGVVHERAGTFDLAQLRGLVHRMPTIGWLLVLASLGSLGMPGMSGFVAEFLIIAASFDRFGLYAIIPVMGMILAGAYFLRLIAVLFGDTKGASPSHGRPLDDGISALPFALLLAAAFLLGCLPFLLLDLLKVIA